MKVISFSLWGDNPKYTVGAFKNAQLTNTIYKGWISRFYCASSVPADIISELKNIPNCEVILMEQDGWQGLFWRFLAASDSQVSVMISRDTDSRLTLREKEAVDEWIDSDKKFHIMRDHPLHDCEILGGLWGVKAPFLHNMDRLIATYNKDVTKGTDQMFLREIIYPIVKDEAFVHDPFFEKKPFPSKRVGYQFVGEIYLNDGPSEGPYYHTLLKRYNGFSRFFKNYHLPFLSARRSVFQKLLDYLVKLVIHSNRYSLEVIFKKLLLKKFRAVGYTPKKDIGL